MSGTHRLAARGHPLLRSMVPILIIVIVATLSSGSLPASTSLPAELLTATQARAAGAVIPITPHHEPGGTIVEVGVPAARQVMAVSAQEQARRDAMRLLAVGSAGSVVIRDLVDDPGSGLVVAHVDESQTKIALPGVTAAAFAANEAWLAAIDAAGRLWKVNPTDGQTSRLADGPYLGSLSFTTNGSLLLIDVSSAEAPYLSQLVRFSPETASSTPLMTDPGFVFSARELVDGSVAVVMHPFGGGVSLRRISASGAAISQTPLDAKAIDVSLSDDGSSIAYAVFGDGVYLLGTGRPTRRLADGDMPRIAPNGSSVLVLGGGGSAVVGSNGEEIARFPVGTTGWACGGRCES
jgi:hypothetical protein